MRSRPAVCVRWYQCTNLCSYIAGATARNDTSGDEEGFIHIQKNNERDFSSSGDRLADLV